MTKNSLDDKALAMAARRPPLSFIPPFLPDQTLYSWVTMFHELSGNASKKETLIQLFGSDKAGHQFHIPSRLDAFCAATQGCLGGAEQIVDKATMLPAYLRFRSSTITADVVQRVRGNQTAGVAQTLQIARSRIYGFAPRRACHRCVAEDLYSYGIAYWHRSHQLPGSLVCIHHGTVLHATPVDSHDKRRVGFLTPVQDLRSAGVVPSLSEYSEDVLGLLKRLAVLAVQMVTQPLPGLFSRAVMRQTCVSALQARDLFRENVTDCILHANRDYTDHFKMVSTIPELACALSQRSLRPLWCLLSNIRQQDHPLEYLLLINWLFGSWDAFVLQYAMYCPG